MSFKNKSLRSLSPPHIFGERFKEKREALGWSIEDLAKKTTFSKNQIKQIEDGLSSSFYSANIKFNSAKKIAGDFILPNKNGKTIDENNKVLAEAISALENLGYKRIEIYPIISEQFNQKPNITLETLITQSLRLISKK
jgi:transcriptional regulator with XRE-family HTH domain